jgi:hypothetical protein
MLARLNVDSKDIVEARTFITSIASIERIGLVILCCCHHFRILKLAPNLASGSLLRYEDNSDIRHVEVDIELPVTLTTGEE